MVPGEHGNFLGCNPPPKKRMIAQIGLVPFMTCAGTSFGAWEEERIPTKKSTQVEVSKATQRDQPKEHHTVK